MKKKDKFFFPKTITISFLILIGSNFLTALGHANPLLAWISPLDPIFEITGAVLMFAFYVVKATFRLVFDIFKWIFKGAETTIEGVHSDLVEAPSARKVVISPIVAGNGVEIADPVVAPRPVQPVLPVKTKTPATVKPVDPKLHCPMCGEKFTNEMMTLLKQKMKVYCEFCGHELEYVLE